MSTQMVTKPQAALKNTVESFFSKNKTKILDALPQGFEPERFLALLLNEMRRVPELQQCTSASLFGCMIKAAQLGLEPGTGQIFLNPRKNNKKGIMEAEFQVGYPGYLALAYRSEKIDYIDGMVVKEKDLFDIDVAKGEYSHKPYFGNDPGKVICAYAILHFVNGNKIIKLCSMERINKAREASSNKTEWGAWTKHYDAMCQKTAIINMLKYSQLTTEIASLNDMQHNPIDDMGEEFGFIDTETGEVIDAQSAKLEQKSQLDSMAEGI